MPGYVTIGVNDMTGAEACYDALRGELGVTDVGGSGERMPICYGAYVGDPGGNNLRFFELDH